VARNAAQRSGDYDNLKDLYRPGHADWVWEAKYGFRDHRGGGRSSGRETLGRVAAGAAARAFLAGFGVTIRAWTSSAAGIDAPGPGESGFDLDEAERNPLRVPHRETAERIFKVIEELRAKGDSAGGVVSCMAAGLPPGLGDPVFGKLDARIAAAMLSIGAAKAVAFGAGFAAASSRGSLQNDRPLPKDRTAADGGGNTAECNSVAAHRRGSGGASGPLPPGIPGIVYETNNSGGVLGGISTGMPLEFTVAFKPVASISVHQKTADREGNVRDLVIQGRHDVCVCPRAVPVVEAMTALALADLLLLNRCGRV
jgi:chorismate synthase